jgi:hypothetical protein
MRKFTRSIQRQWSTNHKPCYIKGSDNKQYLRTFQGRIYINIRGHHQIQELKAKLTMSHDK